MLCSSSYTSQPICQQTANITSPFTKLKKKSFTFQIHISYCHLISHNGNIFSLKIVIIFFYAAGPASAVRSSRQQSSKQTLVNK
jgi:hypothetical protein